MKNEKRIRLNSQLIKSIVVISSFILLRNIARLSEDIFPGSNITYLLSHYSVFVYVVLILLWAIMVYIRVTQRETRKYLIVIAAIMIFWLVIRIIKHDLHDAFVVRMLWYLYYVAILYIPVLVLIIAFSLGKSENYKTGRLKKSLFVPSGILFLLIITNDFHFLAFSFPQGMELSNSIYDYGIVYYIVAFWVSICTISALVIMIKNCRVPYSKKVIYFPIVPIIPIIAYAIIYILEILEVIPILGIFRDMTSFDCVMIMTALECCICCGIIPSNTNYKKLFTLSTIGALITDRNYSLIISSGNADFDYRQVKSCDSIITQDKMRLSRYELSGDYVIWQEDVSGLLHTVEELEDIDEFLQGKVSTLQQELESKKKHRQLVEQNRIYNLMQNKTASQVQWISELTEEFKKTDDVEKEKYLLSKIAVICAFIKRRNNLIFLSQDQNELPSKELSYCINESLNNLELSGVVCNYKVTLDEKIPFFVLVELYERLEQIIEGVFDGASVFFVNVKQNNQEYILSARVVTMSDVSSLAQNMTIECEEDNAYLITYSVRGQTL